MDTAALQTAALAALDKLSKPSWRSPTWWICTALPVCAPVVLMALGLAPTAPVSIICMSTVALAGVVIGHWKDGMVKTAIAAAPGAWDLFREVHLSKTAELAAVKPAPHSSMSPTVYMRPLPSVPGEAPQAADPENPKR